MSGFAPLRTVQKPGVFCTPSGELLKSRTFNTSTGSAVEAEQRVDELMTLAIKLYGEYICPEPLSSNVLLRYIKNGMFVRLSKIQCM